MFGDAAAVVEGIVSDEAMISCSFIGDESDAPDVVDRVDSGYLNDCGRRNHCQLPLVVPSSWRTGLFRSEKRVFPDGYLQKLSSVVVE
jgi:hypothetical protein